MKAKQIFWRNSGGAQRVGGDQDNAQAHKEGSDERVLFPLVALAGFTGLVDEVGHDHLQQGDGGGDGGEHHQQVEQDTEEGTHSTHTVKNVLHGDEQQGRAAQRALGVQSETGGQHAQSGHERNQGVHADDQQTVLLDVLLTIQIGTIGDHGAHAQRQREEHLAAGGGKYLEQIGCGFDNTIGNGPAGNEHVLQAIHGALQRHGTDDADQQGHEQSGHTDGADLFDTAADAAKDDDHGQRHEDQTVDHAFSRIPYQGIEHAGTGRGTLDRCGNCFRAEACVKQVAHVQNHVLDAVAAQRAVEEQDEERGGDTQPAHPLKLLGYNPVGFHSALTGFTTHGQFTDHNDESAGNAQKNVDQQEREAAIGTHLIGEAPDVAQADRRANSSHQESKIGSKAFSFFHCFLSLLLGCRTRECGVRRVYYFNGWL